MAGIDWATIREQALGEAAVATLPPTMRLPALPYAVMSYVQKSSNPDTPLRELAAIVETDTGLTLELLRYVNSTFIGLKHKARNVQQALSYLGLRQSKMFLITTGMQAAVKARQSKFINQKCFWNASLQKALFAQQVATLMKTDADAAFAGALMQDYLLPVLSNDQVDAYLEFVESRSSQPDCLCDWEQGMFGWNHAVAGAYLAYRWNLPDDLVCCILFHHSGLRLLTHPQLGRSPAAAVALSALLPDQLRQSYQGLEQLTLLETKWPAFRVMALAEEVDAKHKELGVGIHNDYPLARRCRPMLDNALERSDGTLKVAAGCA